jgi:hypothetical protein
MKLTLEQIVNSRSALERLMQVRLQSSIAFRIKRAVRQIEPELVDFETQRTQIVRKYGDETDPESGIWSIKPEHRQEYAAEIATLMAEEFRLDVQTLTVSQLGDIEISAAELMALDWLIVDDEEPALAEAEESPKRRRKPRPKRGKDE